eukprot:19069-Heterococcus_DN1.PRE.6
MRQRQLLLFRSCLAKLGYNREVLSEERYLQLVPAVAAAAESIAYCSAADAASYDLLSDPEQLEDVLWSQYVRCIIRVIVEHARYGWPTAPETAAAAVQPDDSDDEDEDEGEVTLSRPRTQWQQQQQQQQPAVLAVRREVLQRCAFYIARHLSDVLLQLQEEELLKLPVPTVIVQRVAEFALYFEKMLYYSADSLAQYSKRNGVEDRLQRVINARAAELRKQAAAAAKPAAVEPAAAAAAAAAASGKSE